MLEYAMKRMVIPFLGKLNAGESPYKVSSLIIKSE